MGKERSSMNKNSEKKKKNDNKTKNTQISNPISETMNPKGNKPVRGMP